MSGIHEEPGYVQVIEAEHVLPHNLEAEQAVLGAVVVDNALITAVDGLLVDEHFYRAAHRKVWRAIQALDREHIPVDLLTLTERLQRDGDLEDVGGAAYVSRLTDGVPRSTNAVYYAEIVKAKAALRSVIAVTSAIRTRAYEQDAPAEELVSTCEGLLLQMSRGQMDRGFVSAHDWMTETTSAIMRMLETRRVVTGVPTGFGELDWLTRGLHPGNLVVVAARPAMGKTSFALQTALHAAASGGVGFFSMEMSREELGIRAAALQARISSYRIQVGNVTPDEQGRLMAGLDEIAALDLHIDDTPGLTVDQIRSKARRLAMRVPLVVLMVDYMQLVKTVTTRRSDNREREVAEISRTLKEIARELSVPLIVLAQLNRNNETRADKRPVLADLRESGAIEQDADLVLLLHRPEYYEQVATNPGLAEIIVAKQRNGPTGTVKLLFVKDQTRFDRWSEVVV